MHMYGGFEQVGSTLPSADIRITTNPGVLVSSYAFSELIRGKIDYAYNLNENGPSFIHTSIYEKYKRKIKNKWINDHYTGNYIETLLKERDVHSIYGELLSKEDFRKNALKDKKKIYKEIISYILPVKMKLKYIDYEGNAEFRTEINSVFDICWYTLARMIASNASQQDEDLDYGEDRRKDGTLGVCANYGSFLKIIPFKSIVIMHLAKQRELEIM